MEKSKIVLITIALMLIAYVVGVKIGRDQAIHNARLVEDNGETYVIGYSYGYIEGGEELHEYER